MHNTFAARENAARRPAWRPTASKPTEEHRVFKEFLGTFLLGLAALTLNSKSDNLA